MNGLHSFYYVRISCFSSAHISQEEYKQLIHISPSLIDLNLHNILINMISQFLPTLILWLSGVTTELSARIAMTDWEYMQLYRKTHITFLNL
jgi:hypothetical protein